MKSTWILIILIVFVISCSNDQINAPKDLRELMPLEMGNTWNYQIFIAAGAIPPDSTIEIDHEIFIEGEKYYGESASNIVYRNMSDGLQIGYYENGNFSQKYIFYHPNSEMSKTLNLSGSFNYKHSEGSTRIGQELLKYYKYQWTEDNGDIIIFYFSLGVGLIRKQIYTKIDPNQDIYQLFDWTLKEYELIN